MDERVKGALIKFVDDTTLRKVANAWEESGKINKTSATTVSRKNRIKFEIKKCKFM